MNKLLTSHEQVPAVVIIRLETGKNTIPGIWLRSLCVTGCGAYESVIIRFKARPVQLNLPTGTELGNRGHGRHFSHRKLFMSNKST